jgi:hypothetical protein
VIDSLLAWRRGSPRQSLEKCLSQGIVSGVHVTWAERDIAPTTASRLGRRCVAVLRRQSPRRSCLLLASIHGTNALSALESALASASSAAAGRRSHFPLGEVYTVGRAPGAGCARSQRAPARASCRCCRSRASARAASSSRSASGRGRSPRGEPRVGQPRRDERTLARGRRSCMCSRSSPSFAR